MVEKIDRSAFLYLAGNSDKQCDSCIFWLSKANRCMLHRAGDKIDGDDSCGFYVPGQPRDMGIPLGLVTPKDSGLVDRQVRCENCYHFAKDNKCGLYEALNKKVPEAFDLDTNVKPRSCCNAQTPMPK